MATVRRASGRATSKDADDAAGDSREVDGEPWRRRARPLQNLLRPMVALVLIFGLLALASVMSEDAEDAVALRGRAKEWEQQCHLGDYLRSAQHGCYTDSVTLLMSCSFQLRVVPAKIRGQFGGEELASVMGQAEEVEFLTYERGAFEFMNPDASEEMSAVSAIVSSMVGVEPAALSLVDTWHQGRFNKHHYLWDVINASVTSPLESLICKEMRPRPTVFLTRYEYVNLYHQMTDLFNAFLAVSAHEAANKNGGDEAQAPLGKYDVVFLDAHPKGNLDSVWPTLFGGTITPVRKLLPLTHDGKEAEDMLDESEQLEDMLEESSGPPAVCFDEAIFVPPGYSSPLWPQPGKNSRMPCPRVMSQFVAFVLKAYSLADVRMERGRVAIISRKAYVAHARSKPGVIARTIEHLDLLQQRLNEKQGVRAEIVYLEDLALGEQIRTLRSAEVLIANHGAALSHLLFMCEGAHVFEFQQKVGNRKRGVLQRLLGGGGGDRGHNPMFQDFAAWRTGLSHHLLQEAPSEMDGAIAGDIADVISRAVWPSALVEPPS